MYIYIYIYKKCQCTYIYIYIYIYRICTSCRELEANVYANVHNICLTYTPAHAWCATTPVNACRLCAKNAYGLVYARLFNCAAASLPWKLLRTYVESCANIVHAVVSTRPPAPLLLLSFSPSVQISFEQVTRKINGPSDGVKHHSVNDSTRISLVS